MIHTLNLTLFLHFCQYNFRVILNINYILSFHFRFNYILEKYYNLIQYHFYYLITNSTGQWSDPNTSACIFALSNLSSSEFDTTK